MAVIILPLRAMMRFKLKVRGNPEVALSQVALSYNDPQFHFVGAKLTTGIQTYNLANHYTRLSYIFNR